MDSGAPIQQESKDRTDARDPSYLNIAKAEDTQIPEIIMRFTGRIRSIHRCAKEHIEIAEQIHRAISETITAKATPGKEPGDAQEIVFTDHIQIEEFVSRMRGPHSDILSQSLLIFGFSTFDAYEGMLLRRLYREAPNLIFKVEEKTIAVGELVNCVSLDEAVSRIVERDISGLLRHSYDEQFSTLANRHGLSTLKKFETWSRFIEAAQRRNLITHCDGIVNGQYLSACRSAGYKFDVEPSVGEQLTVSREYLERALDILYEVGLKLGHILWRTACPERIEQSEKAITDELFALLTREDWKLAAKIGEFAINLPDQKLDLQNRISRINYAQAVKWSGDRAHAMRILDAVDWSGSIRDLRLGVEVLRENYNNAASLMREIGKKGELVLEAGYRNWPVFREFRRTEEFRNAFADVYGIPFAEKPSTPPAEAAEGAASSIDMANSRTELIEPKPGENEMPSSQPQELEVNQESSGQFPPAA